MAGLSKLNDKTVGAILGAMRIGVSHEMAAEAAGISRNTLYRWLRQGEEDEAKRSDRG
jgi:transposase-like protein